MSVTLLALPRFVNPISQKSQKAPHLPWWEDLEPSDVHVCDERLLSWVQSPRLLVLTHVCLGYHVILRFADHFTIVCEVADEALIRG